VRPAPQDPPGKFETGTGNIEGIARVLGVEGSDRMVRVGPVHYNTVEEIEMVGKILGDTATP